MTPNTQLNFNTITAFLVFACIAGSAAAFLWGHFYVAYAGIAVAALIGSSLKMANVWQKFVILRMGKLQGVRGAGLLATVPLLDHVVAVIDSRPDHGVQRGTGTDEGLLALNA